MRTEGSKRLDSTGLPPVASLLPTELKSNLFITFEKMMQVKTAVYLLAALLAVTSTIREVQGDAEVHKGQKMAEALKMLQSLDKYYGQIARPRSPRSSPYGVHLLSRKDEASLKMRLRDLDNQYLHRSRPRYGKRGDFPRLEDRLNDVINEEINEEPMWEPLR